MTITLTQEQRKELVQEIKDAIKDNNTTTDKDYSWVNTTNDPHLWLLIDIYKKASIISFYSKDKIGQEALDIFKHMINNTINIIV